jgi:hypothetical protein
MADGTFFVAYSADGVIKAITTHTRTLPSGKELRMTSLSTGSEENKEGPRTGDGDAITVASPIERADATTPLTVVADSVKAARETGDQVDAVSPAWPADTELEEIAGFKVHPLASRWPLIVGQQFEDFVEAASHGRSLQAVETNNGFLIDGRNRLRVQEELRRRGFEIDVPVVEWEPSGDETVAGHIWAVNAHRRHQTADQLAALCASTFLPAIQAEREARQRASRFGKNSEGTAAAISTPPDGQVEKPRRTSAEKDAASSAGCLAALANVSLYKARQAVALDAGVVSGEIPKAIFNAVVAGELPLRKALPKSRKRSNKKTKQASRAACEDVSDLSLDATSLSPLQAEIDQFWQSLVDEVPVTEHRDMCHMLERKINDMKQQHGW